MDSFDINNFIETNSNYATMVDQVEIPIENFYHNTYNREQFPEENENYICEKYSSNYTSTEYMDSASSPDSSESHSDKAKKSYVVVNNVTVDKTAKVEKPNAIKKMELENKREAAKLREAAKKKEKEKEKEKEKKKFDLSDVPEKYIPPEFYDADPKQQKKMMQMIRNRLSAQNSRDKKKQEHQILIDENQALKEENQKLKHELEESRRYIEELKRLAHSNNNIEQSANIPDSEDTGSLSEPYSPSRRSSFKGIFSFSTLAFIGVLAIICMMGPTTDFGAKKANNFGPRNLLAVPEMKTPKYETLIFDYKFPAIHMLMKNFVENSYQKYLNYQKEETINNLIVDPKENMTNGFYMRDLTDRDLTLTNKNTLIIEEPSSSNFNTSTLFCPSSFEFFNQKLSDVDPMISFDERSKLIDAEHIQLIIPLNGLRFSYENDNISVPVPKEAENKYYEILCKVYSIREIEINKS